MTNADQRRSENGDGIIEPAVIARIDKMTRARGDDYARLVEYRRESRRARKHTPEQREKERARKHSSKQREKERTRKQLARQQQTPEQRNKIHPFMSVDGEGGGTDRLGRQHYQLMMAAGATGERHMTHRDSKPLSVIDCLEFLLSLPAQPILVSFYFGYDVTQILRGIGRIPTLRRILDPPQSEYGPRSTYWGDYAITYQQGQYFRVARLDRRGPKPAVIKGSTRTVYDAFGFFQCSFVKAINDWKIGSDAERAIIDKNKKLRNEFSELTEEIIDYCELECRLLAMLMTALREVCTEAGISPKQWSGAGWLATALFEKHGIPKRPLTAKEAAAEAARKPGKNLKSAPRRPPRDPEFERAANFAYYGGHFEVSRIGAIGGPVYEYDINSAYPAAMPELPCPLHTRWQHRPRARHLPKDGIYLAKITFTHPDGPWCGLPFRHNGGLFWPFDGTGWYWSCEIDATRRCLGTKIIRVYDLWIAQRCCDCRLYDWVPALYEERRRIGSKTRGYPLKIGSAALSGKHAQRSGRGPYHDAVAAGLITATTRASLIEAVGHDPKAVAMLATDAVFSTRPLPLDIGDGLGQWEAKPLWPDFFIAQPGVYWSPLKLEFNNMVSGQPEAVKSRGVPRSVIGRAAPLFQQRFNEWIAELRQPGAIQNMLDDRQQIPSVPVAIRIFQGCRLALARNRPWQAGRWKDETREMSFEWCSKRDAMRIRLENDCLVTFPVLLSSPFEESEGYKPADFDRPIKIAGDGSEFETIDERVLLEAQPDFTPWLPHE